MTVAVVKTIAELRDRVRFARSSGQIVGLTPTMGALHEGHASLIRKARLECGFVVVSIFVNPLQFGPKEDFQRYPRDLEADITLCAKHGADLVFAPEVDEVYPVPARTIVDVAQVSEGLCGASRPGHFRGVATVVLKLFNIVQPDRAYFGEKDAQQLAVIRRMVSDLNLEVKIVSVPTVRELDGIAMSSRNRYLNAEERRAAPILYRALQFIRSRIDEGLHDATIVKEEGLSILRGNPLVRVEYLEVVDPEDMQPVSEISGRVRILAAIWIGKTRLIDNILAES